MNRKTILSLFALAALCACTKGHVGADGKSRALDSTSPSVEFVKGLPSNAPGLTYGQVLGNSPNCATRQWSDDKDKYGRDVVTFRCDLAIPKERLDQFEKETEAVLRKNVTGFGATCSDLATAYLGQVALPKLNAYFARFSSVSEVMQFVVNQGQVVETRAGLNDAQDQAFDLNAYGLSLVAGDLQATGDGREGLSHLFQMAADLSPYTSPSCYEMKQAVPSGASPSQGAASDSVSVSPGDAEPEPKGYR